MFLQCAFIYKRNVDTHKPAPEAVVVCAMHLCLKEMA